MNEDTGGADVVLVRPASAPLAAKVRESRPPAGLLYIAAPLVRDGVRVVIIDQLSQPDWLERLRAAIDERTICVGITSLTSHMIVNGIEIARRAREKRPGCPIVWGGVHPSMETDSTIASPFVDIVVIGEGEETFAELVAALRSGSDLRGVRGIAFKDAGGAAVKTGPRPPYDLDLLPPLPLQLVDFAAYRGHEMLKRFFRFDAPLAVSIETSRGCTHRCTYCVMASRNFAQKARWKGMSALKIVEVIEPIIERCGVRAFAFIDDNFFVDLDRVRAFLDELERRSLRIEWFADARMDTIANKMDVPFLRRLERNGLKTLGIGIESGSDRMLRYLHKGETRETYLRANRLLAQTGITPQYGLIQGLPTETLADALATYTLVSTLVLENRRASPTLNKLLPTPGTPLLEECVKHGFIPPRDFAGWADYCDTSWSRGPAVWMDEAAAAFMTRPEQVLYRQALSKARQWEGRKSRLFEALLLVLSREMLFRARHDFRALPIGGWLFRAFGAVRSALRSQAPRRP